MRSGIDELEEVVVAASEHPDSLSDEEVVAVERTMELLDKGRIRLAEKVDGEWLVNGWIQLAINLYFRVTEMETLHAGPLEFYDRMPLKHGYEGRGNRVVAGGIARYGSHLEPGVVLMPGFVNIGAYVGSGTVVDTWATVGSGAQIGRRVHLSGGVGIGGVLEPAFARPVIIEDDAFIGSRSIIVEGVIVGEAAVIAAQSSITASTHVIDVTRNPPVTYKGEIPPRSIVIPGSRSREFPGGTFEVNCALIIGERSEVHAGKLALMDAARDFGFAL